MKIAILAPMPWELAPVVAAFGLQKTGSGSAAMPAGTIGDVEIVSTTTGIGTTEASRATERVLDAVSVDHVMVVGIAGGVGTTVGIGDLVVPTVVIDRPTGTEYRPTTLGGTTERGKLSTGDDFLVRPEDLTQLIADDVIALDMETSAIAAVCTARGCQWSVIRAISDMATDHPDDAVVGLAKPDGSANGPALAKFLLTRPWRIPHLAKLFRDSKVAATNAARAAARACAAPTSA